MPVNFGIAEILGGALVGEKPAATPTMTAEEAAAHATALSRAFAALSVVHEFTLGDLAVWKPGLCDRRAGQYGRPMMIVGLEPGRLDRDGDPCDVRIMDLSENSGIAEAWIDARRIEPFVAGAAVQPGINSGDEQVFDPSC